MVNQENGVDLKSATQSDERKLFIETYGCQMNERDSESAAAMLVSAGHHIVNSEQDADIIILNTCSVREQAERKAIGKLGILGEDDAGLGETAGTDET